jgi:hypothetical protein
VPFAGAFFATRPRAARALVCSGVLAFLIVLRASDPATSGLFAPCPFRALTGWLCPGCGTLRALHALLHGRVLTALRLNPVMIAALPYVGWELARWVARRPPLPVRARVCWALVGLLAAWWLARNLAPITSA